MHNFDNSDRYQNAQGENRFSYSSSPSLYIKKRKKQVNSKRSIVALLCGTVVVSSAFGFAGGMLADSFNNTYSNPTVVDSSSCEAVLHGSEHNIGITAEVAATAMDSVVEIRTESVTLGNRIMGQYISEGAGSGVIYSKDGYIITNNHVIDGANKIDVTLRNGKVYEAEIIGTDAKTDLAVIKINGENLKAAKLGDSTQLVVGETVLAIGNPLGQLGGTVTNGIISALDREIDIEGEKMTLLQTNASVNPGNSGGGLFDYSGNLIGIVNAKSSGSGIEGLGFAIPISTAQPIIDQLIEIGYVSGRINIGMNFMDVDARSAFIYGLKNAGVYVSEVEKGSYAEKIGIRTGDRIVSIDGVEVTITEQLMNIFEKYKVGDSVELKVERDGKQAKASFVLEEDKRDNGNLF